MDFMSSAASSSLLLLTNDTVFAEMLKVVGHTQTEIDQILPLFRKQFLMTFFFAIATYIEDGKVEPLLERLKAQDMTAMAEITQGRSQEELIGSYLYAFEEVYGGYAKVVGPQFSEEQKQQLQALAQQSFGQGQDG